MIPALGVCYYPEHWDRALWARDAARMIDAGISWVRIGEFAWSRIEPKPGQFEFDWLDEAITVLGEAGLKVVMCTPTATPPRWMLDKHPDMLAVDAQGNPRKFGSRRHYCFSHRPYIVECQRIAQILLKTNVCLFPVPADHAGRICWKASLRSCGCIVQKLASLQKLLA